MGEFINKDGGCISWDDIKEIKVLGLYFSAQWVRVDKWMDGWMSRWTDINVVFTCKSVQ